jgi:hypothetical protein
MKKARLILTASILSLVTLSMVTFTSCTKDDEACPVGMEGKNCDVEMRTKFVNSWSAVDVVNGNQLVYTCNIAKGLNINQVTISNAFSDHFFSNNISATVDGTTITIADQKPDGSTSMYSVSGSGTYTNNQISWNYLIVEDVTGAKQNYTGIWTAQ